MRFTWDLPSAVTIDLPHGRANRMPNVIAGRTRAARAIRPVQPSPEDSVPGRPSSKANTRCRLPAAWIDYRMQARRMRAGEVSMNVVLWILQVLLAAAFFAHGLMFLAPPPDIAVLMNE